MGSFGWLFLCSIAPLVVWLVGWLVGWSSCWLFVLQGTLFGRFVQLFGWLLFCSVYRQLACISLGRPFGSFLRPSGEVFKIYIALSTLCVLLYISAKWGKNGILCWLWNQYKY